MSLNFHKLTVLQMHGQYTGWSVLVIIWRQLNVVIFYLIA